jgi:hypothetical protein
MNARQVKEALRPSSDFRNRFEEVCLTRRRWQSDEESVVVVVVVTTDEQATC